MITNRDKINAMSNKELAEILTNLADDTLSYDQCKYCSKCDGMEFFCEGTREECKQGTVEWLESEVLESETKPSS